MIPSVLVYRFDATLRFGSMSEMYSDAQSIRAHGDGVGYKCCKVSGIVNLKD